MTNWITGVLLIVSRFRFPSRRCGNGGSQLYRGRCVFGLIASIAPRAPSGPRGIPSAVRCDVARIINIPSRSIFTKVSIFSRHAILAPVSPSKCLAVRRKMAQEDSMAELRS